MNVEHKKPDLLFKFNLLTSPSTLKTNDHMRDVNHYYLATRFPTHGNAL